MIKPASLRRFTVVPFNLKERGLLSKGTWTVGAELAATWRFMGSYFVGF